MRKKSLIYGLSTLIPMLVMLIVWAYNGIYPFGSNSLMAIDFAHQYISLYAFMKRCILTGDISGLLYSFSKSLGGNMIGIWGFNLISPFNIFYVLFPISQINWAILLSILFRYGAMGLAFSHFLVKRHDGANANPLLIVTLATAYALNGFNVAYQMNPIFYDAMIMLPLVLIGVEEVLDGRNPVKYIVLLCLTLILHYYMGYMICIFIVLYALFYLVSRAYGSENQSKFKVGFQKLLRLALYSIIAVGIVAILLLPIIFNLMNSKGALENTLIFEWKFQIDPADLLSKLIMGSFDNTSWSAGPSLPNIYVGSIGLFGSIYYFISRDIKLREKLISLFIVGVFFISFAHKFTNKLWHMGQTPAGFFYRFSWIAAFFLLFLAYKAFRNMDNIKIPDVLFGLGIIILIYMVVSGREYSYLEPGQLIASCVIFIVIMLLLFFIKDQWWKWSLIGIISFAEVGASAAIVQSRINYIDAYKFMNALEVNQEALEPIVPNNKEFYRIAKSFYRSKNDPFMFNYPGMTNFSSNLESTTRELFERLGNNAVDASTLYYGTPLMDALFGIKYYLDIKPYTDLSPEEQETTHIFGRKVNRIDIFEAQQPVDETRFLKVFENDNYLPLAFGINNQMAQLTLQIDTPAANQMAIMNALDSKYKDAISYESFEKIVINNMTSDKTPTGQQLFTRKDASQEGMVKYIFKPTTDDSYYISIPETLSSVEQKITMFLNGANYDYSNKFTNTQLWNVANNSKGTEQAFEIRSSEDKSLDLTGVNLVRFDKAMINDAISEMKKDELVIDQWGNNFVKGSAQISENNHWMLMTVPYDKGWTIKVDGKKVETRKLWDTMLGFKVNPGKHQIEMKFIPYGLRLGAVISIISIILLVVIMVIEKRKKKNR